MIKRAIFDEIKFHLNQKEISLIVGPRQAGKTTLMLLLKDFLDKQGEPTMYLNFDIERDRQFFISQDALISKIRLEFGQKMGYVFIDEIQRKKDAGLFLKGLYDMSLPYKFIVSGSGSVELKEKIHESLAGRKRIFELSTITFEEFAHYRTEYRYEGKLSEFFKLDAIGAKDLIDEYLKFGGYPRVVIAPTIEEKRKIIDEIYQSFIEKDISYLLAVRKTDDFTRLVRVISSQVGQLVNFSELSSTLGISVKTVQQYLWYLERTFILRRVAPYFQNIRKEITKAPVFYFCDLGLRNYAAGEFDSVQEASVGFVFENFVYRLLSEYLSPSNIPLYFWRTKDGAEVDFVVELASGILPVEIKYQNMKRPEIPRSLRNFITRYKPSRALVINRALLAEERLGENTSVQFVPIHLLTKEIVMGKKKNS